MSTKQQEFLDYLKNPTKARLQQAVDEFYENHRDSIHSVFMYEYYKDEYAIEIMADARTWYETDQILMSTMGKYLKNPVVKLRIHTEEEDGLFRRSYFVTEA